MAGSTFNQEACQSLLPHWRGAMNYPNLKPAVLSVWLLTMVLNTEPAQSAWEIKAVRLAHAPEEIVLRERGRGIDRVRVKSRGVWLDISLCEQKLCSKPARRGLVKGTPPRDALPDGRVALGANNIKAAWLSKPTRRYDHGILGDEIEAGALSVVDGFGVKHRMVLPLDEVFEDRYARIVDLDGDGFDEIVVVRTSLKRGAALAVFKLGGKGVVQVARTPWLGRKGSWLNPAGFGDYDGDGKTEIALVVMPDHGGRLEFWEYSSGRLRHEMSLRGFSNHVTGSRVLNMSVSANFDGLGKVDLAIPGARRDVLRIISLDGGMVAEPAHLRLPGRVVTEMVSIVHNGRPAIIAGLDTGMVVLVSNNAPRTNSSSSVSYDVPSWARKKDETSLIKKLMGQNQRLGRAKKSGPGG